MVMLLPDMDNFIDWHATATWIITNVRTVAGPVGITGGGVGFVKFLRHAPAPKKSSLWAGCLFDTFQDLASNDSRVGERRPNDNEPQTRL
jgi:hypothetical protein